MARSASAILVLAAGLVTAGAATGCDDGGGGSSAPTSTVDGTWEMQSTWNLAAPVGGERTVGAFASELLVEKFVQKAGVPSFLEDEAYDHLLDLVGDDLATGVDDQMPAELAPDSPLMSALSATLASVDVTSRLTLEGTDAQLQGTEEIIRLSVMHEGQTYTIGTDELALRHDPSLGGGAPVPVVQAEWSGQRADGATTVDIEPHEFELYYGELVLWVVDEVVATTVGTTSGELATEFACGPVLDTIRGGDGGLSFSVGGMDFGLDRGELDSACADVLSASGDHALGLFASDARATLGGPIVVADDDGDGAADALTSAEGFGGVVRVWTRATSPPLSATFSATRLVR